MAPSVTTYVCLAVGLVLLAYAVWERLGRGRSARAWTRSVSESGLRFSLFVLPGIGMLALALGLAPWADDSALAGLVLLVLVAAGLVCLFGWGAMRLPYPRWTVPGWARDGVATRFGKRGWQR